MTIQETLTALLAGKGLTVYPLSVPVKGTYPNVVYQMISNRQVRSHVGVEAERPRMQLSVWAKGQDAYLQCVATAQTVKNAMDLNKTDFMLATKENEMDAKEVEPEMYRVILDYFVWERS